jgi:hypothetical protein
MTTMAFLATLFTSGGFDGWAFWSTKDLSKINFPDFQFSICFSDMI